MRKEVHLHADSRQHQRQNQLPSDFWDLTYRLTQSCQIWRRNSHWTRKGLLYGDDRVQNVRDEASGTLFLARSMYLHNTLIHPATKFVVVTKLGKGHNFFGPWDPPLESGACGPSVVTLQYLVALCWRMLAPRDWVQWCTVPLRCRAIFEHKTCLFLDGLMTNLVVLGQTLWV